jgi:hypothetical protein
MSKREKCKQCGFSIRGKKHEEGAHHNNKVPANKTKSKRAHR